MKSTIGQNFICCNKPEYYFGVGPLNDSITVTANHKMVGYFIYFLHNPTSKIFLQYLELFLTKTKEYLTIYYTGQGSSVRDTTKDESDGYDEVMLFDDFYVLDNKLAEMIKNHKNGQVNVILINDCCHRRTIWGIPTDHEQMAQFPPNIVCLSAADDEQTAKQGKQGNNNQGFFTFFLFQEVRRNRAIALLQLKFKIKCQVSL